MAVELVLPDTVPLVWGSVHHYITEYLNKSRGETDLRHTLQELLDGRMQLWLVIEEDDILAVMTTRITTFPMFKTLQIVGLTGNGWHRWAGAHSVIEDFARHHECKYIDFYGRPGWARRMASTGFKGQHGEEYKSSYHLSHMELD